MRANSDPVVIGIVGLAGSGKSTASRILESMGLKVIYFGQVVLEEVTRRGLDLNHDNERVVRESLRIDFGMDVIAKRSVPSIEKCVSEGHSVVIDGIYSMSEVEILRDEFGLNLCIVAIHSPSARRYALVQMRGIRPLSSEELFNRDAHEIKYLDKARPIVLADEHVVNDSSIENLEMHLKKVLQLRVSMVGGLDC